MFGSSKTLIFYEYLFGWLAWKQTISILSNNTPKLQKRTSADVLAGVLHGRNEVRHKAVNAALVLNCAAHALRHFYLVLLPVNNVS